MSGFITYIQFLWDSKNQHGIHSLFVYKLYTEGLKNKQLKNSNRTLQGLQRIVSYFKFSQINCSDSLKHLCLTITEMKADPSAEGQLLCCSIKEFEILDKAVLEAKNPIFVTDLYESKESITIWNQFCNNVKIDVSIDCYYYGLLFFRPSQRKEHFKLRT
jgi:hypothetical protein